MNSLEITLYIDGEPHMVEARGITKANFEQNLEQLKKEMQRIGADLLKEM